MLEEHGTLRLKKLVNNYFWLTPGLKVTFVSSCFQTTKSSSMMSLTSLKVTTVLTLMSLLPWTSLASLKHSRSQNRQLQRSIRHDQITLVLEGVRERALNSVKADPLLLVTFPDIDNQFKVSRMYLVYTGCFRQKNNKSIGNDSCSLSSRVLDFIWNTQ